MSDLPELNYEQSGALHNLVKYVARDEVKHFQECSADERAGHIYKDVYVLQKYLGIKPDVLIPSLEKFNCRLVLESKELIIVHDNDITTLGYSENEISDCWHSVTFDGHVYDVHLLHDEKWEVSIYFVNPDTNTSDFIEESTAKVELSVK